MKTFRQGDVALIQISKLPAGLTLADGQERKIILAWGEATGHHHRIEDHVIGETAAAEIAEAAIARARLWRAPSGERYLEVRKTVSLRHEEHAPITLPPGIYSLPRQCEYTPAELRRVTD